jgi:hypothetical protein
LLRDEVDMLPVDVEALVARDLLLPAGVASAQKKAVFSKPK